MRADLAAKGMLDDENGMVALACMLAAQLDTLKSSTGAAALGRELRITLQAIGARDTGPKDRLARLAENRQKRRA